MIRPDEEVLFEAASSSRRGRGRGGSTTFDEDVAQAERDVEIKKEEVELQALVIERIDE